MTQEPDARGYSLGVNRDVVTAILFLAFTAAYAVQLTELPVPFEDGRAGPAFYPAILSTIMVVCSGILLVRGLRKEADLHVPVGKFVRPMAYVVATALYAALFFRAGYVLSTLLYVSAVAAIFECDKRPFARVLLFAALVGVGVTVVGYLFFQMLFGVRLPRGAFS